MTNPTTETKQIFIARNDGRGYLQHWTEKKVDEARRVLSGATGVITIEETGTTTYLAARAVRSIEVRHPKDPEAW